MNVTVQELSHKIDFPTIVEGLLNGIGQNIGLIMKHPTHWTGFLSLSSYYVNPYYYCFWVILTPGLTSTA